MNKNALIALFMTIALFFTGHASTAGKAYDFDLECGHLKQCGFPFNNLKSTLNNAQRGDLVRIYNGNGGIIDHDLIRALRTTKATVVTFNRVGTYSMGTVTLMLGDRIVIHKPEIVMQHNVTGFDGKQKRPESIRLHSFYKELYTEREWQKVIGTNQGVWLGGSEVCKRLKHRVYYEDKGVCKIRGYR